MPIEAELRPQLKVQSRQTGAPAGRLGFLIVDEESPHTVAFTAAQLSPKGERLYHGDKEIGVKSLAIEEREKGEPVRHADTMVLPLVLTNKVKFSPTPIVDLQGRPIELGNVVNETHRFIGQTVLVHTSIEKPREALFFSPNAYFKMPAYDTAELTLFKDALELRSFDGNPVATNGDAGALVTLTDGRVLGVVISGIGTRCFAAPLWKLLEGFGDYGPLSSIEAKRRNNALPKSSQELVPKQRSRESTPDFEEKFAISVHGDKDNLTQKQAQTACQVFFDDN